MDYNFWSVISIVLPLLCVLVQAGGLLALPPLLAGLSLVLCVVSSVRVSCFVWPLVFRVVALWPACVVNKRPGRDLAQAQAETNPPTGSISISKH